MISSISISEREESRCGHCAMMGSMFVADEPGWGHQYGTASGPEKTCEAGISDRRWTGIMLVKPGFDPLNVTSGERSDGEFGNVDMTYCISCGAGELSPLSLSVLMAGAWLVQQRTGNSGWVDTIWTFSLGLVGVGECVVADRGHRPITARQCAGCGSGGDLVAPTRDRTLPHSHRRPSPDDPRYAGLARRSGASIRREEDVHLPAKPGVRVDPTGVRDLRCGPLRRPTEPAAGRTISARLILFDRDCWRSAGGFAAQGVSQR